MFGKTLRIEKPKDFVMMSGEYDSFFVPPNPMYREFPQEGSALWALCKTLIAMGYHVPIAAPAAGAATGVVCGVELSGIVTEDVLDKEEQIEDIVEDIKEEASNYGKVEDVLIPKEGNFAGKVKSQPLFCFGALCS